MKQIRKHGPTLTLSFSRNINSYEIFFQMINQQNLEDLKTFHEKIATSLKIVVFLQNAFNTNDDFDEFFNVKIIVQIVMILMNLKK